MSILEFFSRPSDADFDAVLRFIPLLQRLTPEQVVRWEGGEPAGHDIITMAYPVYDGTVDELVQALYDHGFIQNFDWPSWDEAQEYVKRPELVAGANLETCIKLLTTHVRTERFCDGHLAEMITSGHILAVLNRIDELRGTSQGQ